MPLHDWTRVDAGIFHAFHLSWIAELTKVLNGGLLPKGYLALPEQHAGGSVPDLLTLHLGPESLSPPRSPQDSTAVLDVPPRAARTLTLHPARKGKRRTLAIPHMSGNRLVALVEIVRAANKDRPQSVSTFLDKIEHALENGIHAVLLDLFPPGKHDPTGLPTELCHRLDETGTPYDLPSPTSRTFASFAAGESVETFLEYSAVGDSLPDMPLFLWPGHYVNLPAEVTYMEAFKSLPEHYRGMLADEF